MLTTARKREVIAALLAAGEPELANRVSRLAVGVIIRLDEGSEPRSGGRSAYRALVNIKQQLFEASRTMSQSKSAGYLKLAMAALARVVRSVSNQRAGQLLARAADTVKQALRQYDRRSSQSLIQSAMQYIQKAQYALTD